MKLGVPLKPSPWAKALRTDALILARDGALTIEVDIANTGSKAGRETVFLFIRNSMASIARPLLELKDVAQLSLAPAATGTVRFMLAADDLAFPGTGPPSSLD